MRKLTPMLQSASVLRNVARGRHGDGYCGVLRWGRPQPFTAFKSIA